MDFETDDDQQYADAAEAGDGPDAVTTAETAGEGRAPEQDRKLVARIVRTIRDDKHHHKDAFDRMRRDMQVAMWGAEKDWPADNYRANIAGRHIKQKTAALYAKNPRATATRKEKLDFAVWDEDPASLQMATQIIQQAQMAMQAAAMAPPSVDPLTGTVTHEAPQLPPGFEQAQATLEDFQQGMARRQMFKRVGRTLEIVFAYFLGEQKPLDFKRGMKQVVRRALTCGVGYVELDFQRETGPRPALVDHLADIRARLDHLRAIREDIEAGETEATDAEVAELEHSLTEIQNEPDIVLREGLVIDFPLATRVIPDRFCKSLDGFIGARHLTLEYTYTVQEVKEKFGVDIKDSYTAYRPNAGSTREIPVGDVTEEGYGGSYEDDPDWSGDSRPKKDGLVCVWKHYDRPSGLVYWLADGYPEFLMPPAAPSVYVEDFWPVYPLTFNAVENDEHLFPPSDVTLMLDMQREHNRSRHGMREHRQAARPRWVSAKGAFGAEDDVHQLRTLNAFEMVSLNMEPGTRIGDLVQPVPIPGVDPNLYQTEQFFADTQVVVGTQEAMFGGVAKATATESAIAANASTASDGSSIDDLDSFLTVVAHAASQILLREMSEEQVMEIAGPGAVWPQPTLQEIAADIHLEIEAGSTGKPNQAVEIHNWHQMLPLLMQMGDIQPTWLARETLRRLDDRMDLTDAIAAGVPAIVAQNQMAVQAADPGAGPAAPVQGVVDDLASAPAAQGPQGAANAPLPPRGPGGSGPAFGSNQVDGPL